jgi:hypothetical protein
MRPSGANAIAVAFVKLPATSVSVKPVGTVAARVSTPAANVRNAVRIREATENTRRFITHFLDQDFNFEEVCLMGEVPALGLSLLTSGLSESASEPSRINEKNFAVRSCTKKKDRK